MSERAPTAVPGNVVSVLSSSVTHLDPQEAVWRAMVRGWQLQQAGRLLNPSTIEGRVKVVDRFMTFTGEYPWRWQPVDVEEWTASLRAGGAITVSALARERSEAWTFSGGIGVISIQGQISLLNTDSRQTAHLDDGQRQSVTSLVLAGVGHAVLPSAWSALAAACGARRLDGRAQRHPLWQRLPADGPHLRPRRQQPL